jgi:hypothetical protein
MPRHSDRGNPWTRALSIIVDSWPVTLRAGLLIILTTGAIVALGLLFSVTIGPVRVRPH